MFILAPIFWEQPTAFAPEMDFHFKVVLKCLFLRDSLDFKKGRSYSFPNKYQKVNKERNTDISLSKAEFSDPEGAGVTRLPKGRNINTRVRSRQSVWNRQE